MSDSKKRSVYVVLLHYPVLNRSGKELASAVTNLDIHDIARSCKTYGVKRYFIVNPEEEQKKLVSAILMHWKEELTQVYHPSRAQALELVQFFKTFEEMFNEVVVEEGQKPFVAMPDAKELPGAIPYEALKASMDDRPLILVFGTAWGISPAFYKNVDVFLKPLYGQGQYNHLSVRSAVAIVLDKLFGRSVL